MANKKSNSKNKNTKSKLQQKKQSEYEEEYYEPSFFASPLFVHGVIWTLLFVFLTIFMFIPSDALVSNAVRGTLGGIFGILAYVIPFIFAGTLLYLVYTKSVSGMWKKFILSVLAITDLSAIIGLFANYDAVSAYSICRTSMNGGGAAGVLIAEKLSEMITQIGAFLLLFILFVVLCCFIAHYNIWPHLINGVKSFCGFSENVGSKVRQKSGELAEKHRQRREAYEEYDDYLDEELDRGASEKASNSFFDDDEDELPESLIERFKKKKALKVQEEAPRSGHTRTIDIANDFASDLDGNLAAPKQDFFSDDFRDDEKFDLYNMKFSTDSNDEPDISAPEPIVNPDPEPAPIEEKTFVEPEAAAERKEPIGDFQVNEMKQTEQVKEKKLTNNEKLSFRDELNNALQGEYVEYRFPTLDLLDKEKPVSSDLRQELYNKAQQLISVLDNFGVKAKPVQVTQGPAVTRYEIQPSSGTKLSKIVNLANDIAMNLAVSTVLIAPVPGKAGTVGVEIPNNKVTPVSIREMLGSAEFRNAKSKLTVCLGKDIGGNVVVGDIAKWPHALIAGATGSGKSVCINTIVTSILYKADPNDVKLIMVDPKQVELGVYNGIPHLLIPVVTEAKKAAGALNWAVSEMMNRYDLFKDSGVRKLEMYNKLMEKTGGEKLPQIVIIIDELADLMMVAAKEVEDYVCRLAQLARAAGIHLIIATQRPSVDVITGLIKANIPSRIAFFVSSQVDSRTILDKAGAEKLLGMGDMLYFPTGARSTTRVQGAFVSDGEVERIVNFIKDTTPETHYSEDLEEHIERIATGENGVTPDKDDDGDPLLNDAIQLAVELGKISTSMVQRRLSVGYARAGRIVDQMEARGIVSPANGSKPREVLVSHADMVFDNSEGNADE